MSSSKTTESCRLAPVTQNISGMPARLVTTWRLLPSLPRSVGFGPVYGPPGAGDAGPIDARAAEIEAACASQLGQQHQVQLVPHPRGLPLAQPAPARHAAAKTQFLGQVLPGDACAQHEEDAVEGKLVIQARTSSLR
jgi:hypothetical protein